MRPSRTDSFFQDEFGTLLLVIIFASAAAGALLLTLASTSLFAFRAFWLLWRLGTARSRLECGLALVLLQVAAGGYPMLAAWMVLAAAITALRERTWLARTASLLTLVFPCLVLGASRAYLVWLGYWPVLR